MTEKKLKRTAITCMFLCINIRLTAGSIYSHAGKSWSLLLVVAVATLLLWLSIAEKSCYVWSVIAESSLWYAQHSGQILLNVSLATQY